MVFRVYVEKKQGFDVEAKQLANELKTILGIASLKNVRLVNRYDVEGISEELFAQATPTVFSEPQVDNVSADLPDFGSDNVFAVEYLPGQFDQRADSASECIQLISQGERPTVRSAKVYALEGELSDDDIAAIKHYVINPVEAREASLDTKITLKTQVPVPGKVEVIEGFRTMSDADLEQFIADRGLAMDLADLQFCRAHFTEEQRDPTITEIKVIDTYWSDHCRHTTFGTQLDDVQIDDATVQAAFDKYLEMRHELGRDEKPVCLMDMGTIGAKWLKKNGILKNLDESEEINACTVKVKVDVNGHDEDWLFLFKNETHNHPTEIEPFGGAATCIGGCIRDPLSGRSYVYQAMRVTGAADPLKPVSETMPGKLPQRKLVTPPPVIPRMATRSVLPPVRWTRSTTPDMWPSAWRLVRLWPRLRQIMCDAKPRLRATRSSCSAGVPDVTASAAPPARPRRITSNPWSLTAPRYRRAMLPSNVSCSVCSAAVTRAV